MEMYNNGASATAARHLPNACLLLRTKNGLQTATF